MGSKKTNPRLSAATALLGDVPFLVSVIERNPSVQTEVVRLLTTFGLLRGEITRAITWAKEQLKKSATKERVAPGGARDSYSVVGGQICRRVLRDSVEADEALANFSATIVRDIVRDDGAETRRSFDIAVTLATGEDVGVVNVTPAEFEKGSWVLGSVGARANVFEKQEKHLRVAIQQLSSPEVVRAYGHTGFRMLGGRPCFLHGGGAIGADHVTMSLDGALARFRLPAAASDPRDGLTTILRLTEAVPRGIATLLLASAFRAPTVSILPADVTVWIVGPSGTLKSTCAAVPQSLYGEFNRLSFAASWTDTVTALEGKLHSAKDVLLVIDDFSPKGTESWEELRAKASRVLQGVGNGSARDRMRADLTMRPNRPPRTLAFTTAEDVPTEESIMARAVIGRLDPGSVDLKLMATLTARRTEYPPVMRAYVAGLISKYDSLPARLGERFAFWRERYQLPGAHLRTPEALAHMMLGIELLANFATDVGVFTAREAQAFARDSDSALRDLGKAQSAAVGDRDPTERALAVLRELLAQRKVTLEPDRNAGLVSSPGDEAIGWLDEGDTALLLPEATFRVIDEHLKRASEKMPITASTLWRRLTGKGILLNGDAEHATSKRVVGGGTQRVLVARYSLLLGHATGLGNGGNRPPSNGGQQDRGAQANARVDRTANRGAADADAGSERRDPVKNTEDAFALSKGSPESPEAEGSVPRKSSAKTSSDDRCGVQPASVQAHSILGQTGDPGSASVSAREDVDNCLPDLGAKTGNGAAISQSREVTSSGAKDARSRATGSPSAPRTVLHHEFITRIESLDAVAAAVALASTVGLDLESTGLDPLLHKPRLLQLAIPEGPVYVIDLAATDGLGPLADVLRAAEATGHNLQFDLSFLQYHFGVVPRAVWCTLTAAKLLGGGVDLHTKGAHTLKTLALTHLGLEISKEQQASNWSGDLSAGQIEYAARDAVTPMHLRKILERELSDHGLDEVARLEFALIPAIVAMELAGVAFDRERWAALVASRRADGEALRRDVEAVLGIANMQSQPRLLAALRARGLNVAACGEVALKRHAHAFDGPTSASHELRTLVAELPRASTGAPLNAAQMKIVVAAILRARKALAFVHGAGDAISSALTTHADGRVRASMNPLAAPTGRVGCSKPNLLALEKSREVRDCIVPADGHLFVVADYSAIELRVLAHVTGDRALIETFQQGRDPHRERAASISRKPLAEVSSVERDRAKPVNFGFPFGMGAPRFVEHARNDYGIEFSEREAEDIRRSYMRAHPGVARWQQRTKQLMPNCLRTASGRMRLFPDRISGYCERLNLPIQGTAADGAKWALALLHRRLAGTDARIVLFVHDEFVVEVPAQRAEEIKHIVVSTMVEGMEKYVPDVPIVVEADIRKTWAKPPKGGVGKSWGTT